jgi:hypothetical protein
VQERDQRDVMHDKIALLGAIGHTYAREFGETDVTETNVNIDGGIRSAEGAGTSDTLTERSNGSVVLLEKARDGQGQNTAGSCDDTQQGGEITEPPRVGENDLRAPRKIPLVRPVQIRFGSIAARFESRGRRWGKGVFSI